MLATWVCGGVLSAIYIEIITINYRFRFIWVYRVMWSVLRCLPSFYYV